MEHSSLSAVITTILPELAGTINQKEDGVHTVEINKTNKINWNNVKCIIRCVR